ncbi:MAG: hypothetical protein K8S97_15180 [Anaerolineae bacterium]|nr:hypothetical protein [Anaerolineae bacterium]
MPRLNKRYTLTTRQALTRLLLAVLLLLLTGARVLPAARAQDDGLLPLPFFETQHGTLNDTTPMIEYTFEGTGEQVISLLVVTLSGDLDPVVQVINPLGIIVAENDDLDSLVRDAGLEAYALPESGTYTVRVMRYLGAGGTTSGEYALTLTPGFARTEWREPFDPGAVSWLDPTGVGLPLSGGGLRLRVSEPGSSLRAFQPEPVAYQNVYVQADAELFGVMSYAEFGLVLRAQGPDRARAYVFKVNTDAQWAVEMQDETGVFVLRSWSSSSALTGDDWQIGVLARDERFDLFVNGALVGTLIDDRLPEAGAVGLYAGSRADQTDMVTVIFDNVVATTRLGTTYAGWPLALQAWNAPDPEEIINELAAGGHINPWVQHDLYLPEKRIAVTDPDAVFELIGTDQAVYDDFVMGAWANVITTGDDGGCGVTYRWQDERNLDMVFVDSGGGFGVVQARDGELLTNAYDFSPMVGVDGSQLLVIARGGEIILYVNGVLVTQEQVLPGEGRVGVALLNYADVPTNCSWSNIWVWPLVEGE